MTFPGAQAKFMRANPSACPTPTPSHPSESNAIDGVQNVPNEIPAQTTTMDSTIR